MGRKGSKGIWSKRDKRFTKKICDNCNCYIRRGFRIYKGRLLCFNCYQKSVKLIISGSYWKGKKIEDVLNKVYEVKSRINTKGYEISKQISFPKCMINKKFKIVLVENE